MNWNPTTTLWGARSLCKSSGHPAILAFDGNDGLGNLRYNTTHSQGTLLSISLLALPTTKARNIVFRFNIEYSSLRDFGP
jgi:hypothetical protein